MQLSSVNKSLVFPFKKILKAFFVFLAIICLSGLTSQILFESTWFTSSIGFLFSSGNFHVVKEGRLYRSAALSKEDLEEKVKTLGIRTVIDLRRGGDEVEENGYSEKRSLEGLGAEYFWIPLVGSNTHQAGSISRLIEIAKNNHAPVLIHCSSGTHRSGVASAIWLMVAEGENPEIAAKQLSNEFGFFYSERKLKGLIMGHDTIDAIIWNYLKEYHSKGISFQDWFNEQGDKL